MLGYETCVLIDSDKLKEEEINELICSGVKVINWADNVSIEERVFLDTPDNRLIELIQLAKDILTEEMGEENASKSILDSINNIIEVKVLDFSSLNNLDKYRKELGKLAKKKEWFKRADKGKKLGSVVFNYSEEIKEKDIFLKMENIKSWIYE